MSLLQIENLSVSFVNEDSRTEVVSEVSFALDAGKTLGLVGESGCGKSVTAMAIPQLLPRPHAHISAKTCRFDNIDLLQYRDLSSLRGKRIACIFQEPMSAMNPVLKVGDQIAETILQHEPVSRADADSRVIDLLSRVGIKDPELKARQYPHQLSGGMRQRAMIAMAIACKPELLIADEPTTALDVTVQAQVLDLLKDLQKEMGMAMIFISHDLSVIAQLVDHIAVMYAGRIVEYSPADSFFREPKHPYSRALLEAIPRRSLAHKSRLNAIEGIVPAPGERNAGCPFASRCRHATSICQTTSPPQIQEDQRWTACHHVTTFLRVS